jgi:hypothetical protein
MNMNAHSVIFRCNEMILIVPIFSKLLKLTSYVDFLEHL